MRGYGSARLRSLYFKSPQLVKSGLATLYGLGQRHARYGAHFTSSLRFLEEAQYWPGDRLRDHQERQRDEFLTTSIPVTPYYRERNVYAQVLRGGRFSELPILSKADVRSNLRCLYPSDLARTPHRWAHTSGTTGQSLVFPLSTFCFQREYAFRALHYSWGGTALDARRRVAVFAGHPVADPERRRPPFWIYDTANNWLLFSSYHMSARNLPAYVRELERAEPEVIAGYPSAIYLLALAYRQHGRGRLFPKAIFTASETLLAFQRGTIERAFGAKVFNWYGNSEMVANIVECEHEELHLKLEHSFVEVLGEDDRPCQPGETGRLVCTGFGNRAFPLIRYDIGDVVTISRNQVSKCGRGGLIVDSVLGRTEDYVVSADGTLVGRLDHLFKDARAVAEAQVVQEVPGEVILRLVRLPAFQAQDEDEIRAEAALRLGSGTRVMFDYVDAIPRTKGGKFRFVVSHLDQSSVVDSVASGVD